MTISKTLNNTIFWSSLIIIAPLLFWVALTSSGSLGGSDDLMHYKIARYAFKYPHLFLNHWGKPVFTLLASPWAQFGLEAMRCFNVFLALISLVLGKKILEAWNVHHSFLIVPFTLGAPIFYEAIPTTLTEILFALFSLLTIYLATKPKFLLATIVLSFIFFVRNEGFLFWIPWLVWLIVEKQYKYIPFLASGYLFYSVIGGIYYKDFFWLINQMPYGNAVAIYGKGTLLHFVDAQKNITGITLTISSVFGMLLFTVLVKRKTDFRERLQLLTFLWIGIYFSGHSVSWWLGTGGSLGLIRVMAAIIPLFALFAVFGLNYLAVYVLQFGKKFYFAFLFVCIILMIIPWYQMTHKFYPSEQGAKSIKNSLQHFSSFYSIKGKLLYMHPGIPTYLEIDPYDDEKAFQYFGMSNPIKVVSEGDVIIWDAHHSPKEGKLELHTLLNDNHYKLLAFYQPDYYFETFSKPWELYIFEVTNGVDSIDNLQLKNDFIKRLIDDSTKENLEEQPNTEILIKDSFAIYTVNCEDITLAAPYKFCIEMNIQATEAAEISITNREKRTKVKFATSQKISLTEGTNTYKSSFLVDNRACIGTSYSFLLHTPKDIKLLSYKIEAIERVVN